MLVILKAFSKHLLVWKIMFFVAIFKVLLLIYLSSASKVRLFCLHLRSSELFCICISFYVHVYDLQMCVCVL